MQKRNIASCSNAGAAMEKEVERLDKAFEWLVLFLTLAFATFFQWIALVWQKELSELPDFLTPLIFAIRMFFILIIIIVISWFGKIVIQEQNKKTFFRKFAWIWGMSQLWWYMFLTSILVTLEMPIESSGIAMLLAIFGMLPLSYFFYRRIMNLYKADLSDTLFWNFDFLHSYFGHKMCMKASSASIFEETQTLSNSQTPLALVTTA